MATKLFNGPYRVDELHFADLFSKTTNFKHQQQNFKNENSTESLLIDLELFVPHVDKRPHYFLCGFECSIKSERSRGMQIWPSVVFLKCITTNILHTLPWLGKEKLYKDDGRINGKLIEVNCTSFLM